MRRGCCISLQKPLVTLQVLRLLPSLYDHLTRRDNHLFPPRDTSFVWLLWSESAKNRKHSCVVWHLVERAYSPLSFARGSLCWCPMLWPSFVKRKGNCGPPRHKKLPDKLHLSMPMGSFLRKDYKVSGYHVGIPSCAVFWEHRCLTATNKSVAGCC